MLLEMEAQIILSFVQISFQKYSFLKITPFTLYAYTAFDVRYEQEKGGVDMRIGAAYIRVSTDEQLEFSPDSQLKKIREYAKEHDICLPDKNIFREDGISGREADRRPAFQKMIGAAKGMPRPFDVILVWKYSRFARSRSDSIFYKTLLREKLGIDILSISEPIGKDKSSKIYESIIEVMDEYYCDNLSEEVRRGMEERFSRGMIIAPPPIGYKAMDGTYIPDAEQADTVREIFRLCAAGIPLRAIVTHLNEIGLRTKKGRLFEVRTVEYIIRNPVYLGYVRKKGENGEERLVPGAHMPLVERTIFADCAAKMDKSPLRIRPYTRTSARFALSGLVRCSACGSTLTMSSKAGRLQCCAYAKGKCSVSHSVGLARLTEAVLKQIKKDLSGIFVHIHSGMPLQSEAQEKAVLRREQARMHRIEAAYEAGVYSLEYLVQAKKAYQEREKTQKRQERQLKITTLDTQMELPSLLQAAVMYSDGSFANAIFKSVLAHVVFSRTDASVQLFYRGDI